MKIFISWAGTASQELARILKQWLPTVLPYADPWLSSEDIRKGKSWDSELTTQLEATSYCLVCVTTRQVAEAPWVNFEAGAVSKYVTHAHVSPLLVGLKADHLAGLPLARFQCTLFEQSDVRRLLCSINEATDSPISDRRLDRNLRNTWSQLAEDVSEIKLSDEPTLPRGEKKHEDENPALTSGIVSAVEGLWHEILSLEEHFGHLLVIDTLLLASEIETFYASGAKGDIGRALQDYRNLDYMNDMMSRVNDAVAEKTRLFVGERLWLQFFTIRGIYGRYMMLTHKSLKNNKYHDWRHDELMMRHVNACLTPEAVEEAKNRAMGGVQLAVKYVKESFLKEADRVMGVAPRSV